MSFTTSATSTGSMAFPSPGSVLAVGNVSNAAKLSEKTIELTTCAQISAFPGPPFPHHRIVWFGLTQKQERQHGFDAAANLGGRAFILQFKVSSTVLKTGSHKGCRQFACQHQQMQQLRTAFGQVPNCCFYYLPNIGTFDDLAAVNGDLLGNSFMVDLAGLPQTIPPTHRKNGYHYAYLNAATPELTVTSQPFKAEKIFKAKQFVRDAIEGPNLGVSSEHLVQIAREFERTDTRVGDMFFKNAAVAVVLS